MPLGTFPRLCLESQPVLLVLLRLTAISSYHQLVLVKTHDLGHEAVIWIGF